MGRALDILKRQRQDQLEAAPSDVAEDMERVFWTNPINAVSRDPRLLLLEKAKADPRFERVVHFLHKDRLLRDKLSPVHGPDVLPIGADGLYYQDTRAPFLVAEQSTVTGTGEALLWPALFTSLVANYYDINKMNSFVVAGKITTASSTQGNITLTMRYGTTTGGTSIAASAATALAASKTNISWCIEGFVACRAIGSGTSGGLAAWGRMLFDGAGGIFTTAAQMPLLFPATSITSTGVDTTSAQGIIQDVTLGSASDTMNVEYLTFSALN